MDNSSNIFSYFVGGLALISTLISVSLYYRGYLPGAQIKILDELLEETRTMYEKADAEGLLPRDVGHRRKLQTQLVNLEQSTTGLREITYNATTLFKECLALVQGVSKRIMDTAEKVKILRAFLLTATEEERRRRDGICSTVPMSSIVLPASTDESSDSASTLGSQPTIMAATAEDSDTLSLSSTLVPDEARWSIRRSFASIRRWLGLAAEAKSLEDGNMKASVETLPV